MQKGIYLNGWLRDMNQYHPSMPMRTMQIVNDIVDMHGNLLFWSNLGSGSLGLPFLDRDANDPVPPRMRIYGYMNDKEFCTEMKKRDVKVFAILWKAQMWEFPAELNEDESEILSMNILRGASENQKFVGMRELSTNKYPKIFAPMEKYFPDGLYNYFGEKVEDFLEEFKAISLEGRDILTKWVMVPGHGHKCYHPCGNKDSYLTYLKRNVEMMIDANAGGLEYDEFDTQIHPLDNAGCFCRECMAKFRIYLKEHQVQLPEDAGDLDTFDYRQYLLSKGYTDKDLLGRTSRWEIPLYRHFFDMHIGTIEWMLKEIVTHAKDYCRKTRNEEFPVTANVCGFSAITDHCKKYLDFYVGEQMGGNLLRMDSRYRYIGGWANGKDCHAVIALGDAYSLDMVKDSYDGINDRYILYLLEPWAHGCPMSFSYGSWMGNTTTSFWPDLRMQKQMGQWLDEMAPFFGKEHTADVGVIYDSTTAYEEYIYSMGIDTDGLCMDDMQELGQYGSDRGANNFVCFKKLTQALSDSHVLYNVLFNSKDEPITAERLAGYKRIVVPGMSLMDDETVAVLNRFAENGGKVYTVDRCHEGLRSMENYTTENMGLLVSTLAGEMSFIDAPQSSDYGFDLRKTENGWALHLLNYNYNEQTHRIDPIDVTLGIKLPVNKAAAHCFPENPALDVSLNDGTLSVKNAGIYTIIELNP